MLHAMQAPPSTIAEETSTPTHKNAQPLDVQTASPATTKTASHASAAQSYTTEGSTAPEAVTGAPDAPAPAAAPQAHAYPPPSDDPHGGVFKMSAATENEKKRVEKEAHTKIETPPAPAAAHQAHSYPVQDPHQGMFSGLSADTKDKKSTASAGTSDAPPAAPALSPMKQPHGDRDFPGFAAAKDTEQQEAAQPENTLPAPSAAPQAHAYPVQPPTDGMFSGLSAAPEDTAKAAEREAHKPIQTPPAPAAAHQAHVYPVQDPSEGMFSGLSAAPEDAATAADADDKTPPAPAAAHQAHAYPAQDPHEGMFSGLSADAK